MSEPTDLGTMMGTAEAGAVQCPKCHNYCIPSGINERTGICRVCTPADEGPSKVAGMTAERLKECRETSEEWPDSWMKQALHDLVAEHERSWAELKRLRQQIDDVREQNQRLTDSNQRVWADVKRLAEVNRLLAADVERACAERDEAVQAFRSVEADAAIGRAVARMGVGELVTHTSTEWCYGKTSSFKPLGTGPALAECLKATGLMEAAGLMEEECDA